MIKEADVDNDGKIDYKEFGKMMVRELLHNTFFSSCDVNGLSYYRDPNNFLISNFISLRFDYNKKTFVRHDETRRYFCITRVK